MAYRLLNGPDDVAAYDQFLDEGWPARALMAEHIADLLNQSGGQGLHVLELCTGPGKLAATILQRAPIAEYVGVDVSAASLAYAAQRVQGQDAVTSWLEADLNQDGWLEEVAGPFDAVVSLQSVHDLGGETEVARIYTVARRLLTEAGVFVNADLLATETTDPVASPGRFTVERHVALLHEAGFASARCTQQIGDFACLEARGSAARR